MDICCCRFFWLRKSILLHYYLVRILLYVMCHQKMPIFIWEVSVVQLELAVVSAWTVGIWVGEKKSSRSCFRRFLQAPASPPPMGPTSLLEWGGDSSSCLDGLCKPSRAGCMFRAGGPSAASTRVPCLVYRLVQQFIAFQCCCYTLRATALTFAVLKALNTWNTITSVNLCWNPSP